jgi:hypothetical protein
MRLISALTHGREVQYPAVFGRASRVRVQLRPMAFGQNDEWACAQCWTGPWAKDGAIASQGDSISPAGIAVIALRERRPRGGESREQCTQGRQGRCHRTRQANDGCSLEGQPWWKSLMMEGRAIRPVDKEGESLLIA